MMKPLTKYQTFNYKKKHCQMRDKERKKQKNQNIVIEAWRLKKLNSQRRMKIKQKIIIATRNSRTLKVKTA